MIKSDFVRHKTSYTVLLLLIFIVAFSDTYFSVLFLLQNQYPSPSAQKKALISSDTHVEPGLPVHMKIPSLHIDAAIQSVGLTTKGAMDVPTNTVDVGWFKLGSRPGNRGSAVIAGHFDGVDGTPGVFNKLHLLTPGDKLFIQDDHGTTITFTVRVTRTYDPKADVTSAFYQNDGLAHLNLITCDSVWDTIQKSYTKRLIVYADADR